MRLTDAALQRIVHICLFFSKTLYTGKAAFVSRFSWQIPGGRIWWPLSSELGHEIGQDQTGAQSPWSPNHGSDNPLGD